MALDWDSLTVRPVAGIFAQDVEYRPVDAADWIDTRGIFNEPHELIQLGQVPMGDTQPSLDLRLEDLPDVDPKQGDLVRLFDSRVFEVCDPPERQSEPAVRLRLMQVGNGDV